MGTSKAAKMGFSFQMRNIEKRKAQNSKDKGGASMLVLTLIVR